MIRTDVSGQGAINVMLKFSIRSRNGSLLEAAKPTEIGPVVALDWGQDERRPTVARRAGFGDVG